MASAGGATDPPGPGVLEAFGLRGPVRHLAGGQGAAFAVDDVVLKRADDVAEARFVQALAARLRPSGYRLAEPIPTDDGRWVHEGWVANRWLEGLRPAAPDWSLIIGVGEAFAADASGAADGLGRRALTDRAHRWAVADRVAWDEGVVALDAAVRTVDDRLQGLAGQPTSDAATGLVHADLAGNVHVDADGTPVVLDLSLYERPAAWGSAVVVVDALLWHAAPASSIDAQLERCSGVGLLARAARFRLVSDALPGPMSSSELDRYDRLAGCSPTADRRPLAATYPPITPPSMDTWRTTPPPRWGSAPAGRSGIG